MSLFLLPENALFKFANDLNTIYVFLNITGVKSTTIFLCVIQEIAHLKNDKWIYETKPQEYSMLRKEVNPL